MVYLPSISYALAATTLSVLFDTTSASCGHGTSLLRRDAYTKLSARGEIEKRVSVSAFGYLGVDGPTQWANLSPNNSACAASTVQSPIDITSAGASTIAGSALGIKLVDIETAEFENLGSTIEVVMEGKGSTITVNGTEFELKQFHFHTPSEHTIDGEHFPLEMHMVHQAADESIAVIAAPFQLCETGGTTELVATVMSSIKEIATPGTVTETTALSFTALSQNLAAQTFLTYTGSLTTPPCTEGLSFFVASKPLPLDVATYNSIKSVVGFNSRFVQNSLGEANLLSTSKNGSSKAKTTKVTIITSKKEKAHARDFVDTYV